MKNSTVADPAAFVAPWSKEALLSKAQRYAEQMEAFSPDDWQFLLWSTLALELLARAALANISPVLLADLKNWDNVYFALGHEPKAPKFNPKSIDVTTVFSRLRETKINLDPRLESFGKLHMQRRNEELHSGSLPLDNVQSSAWMPVFYETCDALLASLDETLETIFEDATAKSARLMVKAARDESAKAIRGTISAHETVWNEKAEAEREQLTSQAKVWATRQLGHRAKCPACHSDALLTGVAAAPPRKSFAKDEEMIVERQTYVPARFECVACGLKISGLPQLLAANLGDNYTVTFHYDPSEFYAPEPDPWEDFEPDNNEP